MVEHPPALTRLTTFRELLAMAASHLITSFPENIDREAFAWAVTGFTAGEGSFNIICGFCGGRPESFCARISLRIQLRDDDSKSIFLINDFFQCGRIQPYGARNRRAKPQISWGVSKTSDCQNIIIPHFEQHPMSILGSKKHNDFLIWKEAVILKNKTMKNKNRTRGRNPRAWKPKDIDEIERLSQLIKESHRYHEPNECFETPKLRSNHEQCLLF